jgi:hypothetical protein
MSVVPNSTNALFVVTSTWATRKDVSLGEARVVAKFVTSTGKTMTQVVEVGVHKLRLTGGERSKNATLTRKMALVPLLVVVENGRRLRQGVPSNVVVHQKMMEIMQDWFVFWFYPLFALNLYSRPTVHESMIPRPRECDTLFCTLVLYTALCIRHVSMRGRHVVTIH